MINLIKFCDFRRENDLPYFETFYNEIIKSNKFSEKISTKLDWYNARQKMILVICHNRSEYIKFNRLTNFSSYKNRKYFPCIVATFPHNNGDEILDYLNKEKPIYEMEDFL